MITRASGITAPMSSRMVPVSVAAHAEIAISRMSTDHRAQFIKWINSDLLQFLILRFRLLQNGQIRIGVFPCGKEVLVGGLGSRSVALQSICPPQAQMGEIVGDIQRGNAAVVENLLVLGRRLCALFRA